MFQHPCTNKSQIPSLQLNNKTTQRHEDQTKKQQSNKTAKQQNNNKTIYPHSNVLSVSTHVVCICLCENQTNIKINTKTIPKVTQRLCDCSWLIVVLAIPTCHLNHAPFAAIQLQMFSFNESIE